MGGGSYKINHFHVYSSKPNTKIYFVKLGNVEMYVTLLLRHTQLIRYLYNTIDSLLMQIL